MGTIEHLAMRNELLRALLSTCRCVCKNDYWQNLTRSDEFGLCETTLCVLSFLDTFEAFFNAKILVFIHISLIFMVNFRKFRVLDREFRARGR